MDITKDYYKILNVDKNSTDDEIKKSYRKLAKEYHPDKNNGDKKLEEKFKTISEAYQILGDNTTKQQYDIQSPNGNNYNPNYNTFSGFGGGFPFDIFNMFGGGFGQQIFEDLDIHKTINVSFADVYNNKSIDVKFQRKVYCDSCNGDDKNCKKCHGDKLMIKEESLNINNIYQIHQSVNITKHHFGNCSMINKGRCGNLILTINYNNNTNFYISNRGLEYKLDLHYQYAIDGTKILLKMPDNADYNITIPKKTKDGDVLRIVNKGIYAFDGKTRTDLFITINIIIKYE